MIADRTETPEIAAAWDLVRRELEPGRRPLYRALAVVDGLAGALLLSLWLTEPGSPPARLHVAFGGLLLLCVVWSVVLWRLATRGGGGLAEDRVVLTRTALIAALLSTLVGAGVAYARGGAPAAATFGAAGAAATAVAALLHARARGERRALRALKAALTARR